MRVGKILICICVYICTLCMYLYTVTVCAQLLCTSVVPHCSIAEVCCTAELPQITSLEEENAD